MLGSARGKIDRYYEKLQRAREEEKARREPRVTDIMEFCEQLKFKPTAYQEKLFRDLSRFVVCLWSRQSGKSHAIAIIILFQALSRSGSRIVVLAPSLRQSRRIIGRVSMFISKLPWKVLVDKPLMTRLDFLNGSVVEAYPNNPETIRGETLHMVVVDEWGFVEKDEELYDAVVYALSTTNGRFIATSTPGSKDTLLYEMWTDDKRFGTFSRHHVSFRDALEPSGPLKKEILEEIKQQMLNEPWRWSREMEAEFSDDSDAWLPMSLITKCVRENLDYIPESTILAS